MFPPSHSSVTCPSLSHHMYPTPPPPPLSLSGSAVCCLQVGRPVVVEGRTHELLEQEVHSLHVSSAVDRNKYVRAIKH